MRYSISIYLIVCVLIYWFSVSDYYYSTNSNRTYADTLQSKLLEVKSHINYSGDSTLDKRILYIGDSHSCNKFGWQDQLSKLTGMNYEVIAKRGMKTKWMLKNSKFKINNSFDYCLIWGGGNDVSDVYYSLDSSISNIQQIVNLCNSHNIRVIVLTGFNPDVVNITSENIRRWGFYPTRHLQLQNKIKSEIYGALIIQNWYIDRSSGDCGDFICHMTASGHHRMAIGLYNSIFK